MYNVSQQYKEQINKNLRNVSHMKVNFGVITPDASNENIITDNDAMYYSNVDNIDEGANVEKRYLTFEHNKFILDGVNLLPPEPSVGTIPYYQGYVSQSMSDSTGQFTIPPTVRLDFNMPFSFIGLTFRFNKYFNNYPSEFEVIAYYDGVEVFRSMENPTSHEFIMDKAIPSSGFCDRIDLKFHKTFPVKRRVELEYIMFGINILFTNNDIIKSTWTREVDLLSTKLPINNFEFTIIDPMRDYNPENTTGVWKYLEDRQPIYFEYGYELDDGSIEWVKGSNLYSNGEVKVDSKSRLSSVTFKSTSILSTLDEIYYRSVYDVNRPTLYDLALDVLDFANLPLITGGITPYVLDDALKDIRTNVPLPEYKIREVLQLIANAGRCSLSTNRIGQIEIKRMDNLQTGFKLTFDNMLSSPTLNKSPYLHQVQTYLNKVTISSELLEVHKSEVSFIEPTECLLKYDMSTDLTISVSSALTIVGSPIFYAGSCLVTLVGEGTVSIMGYKLIFSKNGVTYNATPTGFVCPVENELLDNEIDAYAYAEWIGHILMKRNEYTVANRGYPEVDVGDIITVDTMFTDNMESVVLGSKISFNGGLSGEIKFLSSEVT